MVRKRTLIEENARTGKENRTKYIKNKFGV